MSGLQEAKRGIKNPVYLEYPNHHFYFCCMLDNNYTMQQ